MFSQAASHSSNSSIELKQVSSGSKGLNRKADAEIYVATEKRLIYTTLLIRRFSQKVCNYVSTCKFVKVNLPDSDGIDRDLPAVIGVACESVRCLVFNEKV